MDFDTLEYVELLSKAGVDEEHAKAQARYLGKVLETHFATKEDIKELDLKIETAKKELDLKIETVKSELKHDIKELDFKIEAVKSELKHDIKELDLKIETVRKEIEAVRKEIETVRKEIETVKSELKLEMRSMESRLTLRVVGYLAAIIAIFVGIQSFLFIYLRQSY